MNPPISNFLATFHDSMKFLLTLGSKHSTIIAIIIIITQKIPAKNEKVIALNVLDNDPFRLIIINENINLKK